MLGAMLAAVARRAGGAMAARARHATVGVGRGRGAPLVRRRCLSTETVQLTFVDSEGDTFRASPRRPDGGVPGPR